MPTVSRIAAIGLVLVSAMVGACCPSPRQPPPPISQDQQVRQLAEWSLALAQVRARTVPLGVELKFQNDKGQQQQQNAEGTLLLRQHPETPGRVGDVLLLGSAFDQSVFEAGRNESVWWFLIRLDTKTAWVGDARKAVDLASLGAADDGSVSSSILRADLVLDLLGLSPLPAHETTGRAPESLVMRVNDARAENELYILRSSSLGRPFIAREIVVDRFTGQVTQVKLYDQRGVVVVRSELRDYRPVTYAEGVSPANPAPAFPRRIMVSYPAQKMSIALQFDTVMVPRPLTDAPFRTPDFEKEQLRVIRVD